MRLHRLFWVVLILAICLGLNGYLGWQAWQGESAQAEDKPDDSYQYTLLLTRVVEHIRQDYVDEKKIGYKALTYAALKGMLASLDPHSQFLDEETFTEMQRETKGEFSGLGIVVGMKDGFITVVSPLEDTPGFRAGLLPGDRILKINQRSTDKMSLSTAIKILRGQRGEKISMAIFRPGNTTSAKPSDNIFEVEMTRETIKVNTVKEAKLLPPETAGDEPIGYIRLEQFGESTVAEMEKAVAGLEKSNLRALVLDMRNNPGGLLDAAIEVAGRFLPATQVIVSTQGRTGESRREYRAKGSKHSLTYPMAVLVNGYSASGAEIVAGALQDCRRAVVVGETTFGKGSVQSVIDLGSGVGMRLTTAKYYTPSNRVIHEVGVIPNIRAPISETEERQLIQLRSPRLLSAEDKLQLKDFRDVQLERAVTVLRGILIYGDHAPAADVPAASLTDPATSPVPVPKAG